MAWGTSDYEACWQMCFPPSARLAGGDRTHGANAALLEPPLFAAQPSRA